MRRLRCLRLEHPERQHFHDLIASLDVERNYEEIYRITVLHELPWEMATSLNLALYRTFASPRIAAVLAQTGEFAAHPTKRAEDTALFVYEVIARGFDDPVSRSLLGRLNRMHKPFGIDPVDYRYVLAAFIVVPSRWVDEHGWRSLSRAERDASVLFFRRFGELMGVRDFPSSYDAIAALFDAYEAEHVHESAEGSALMSATASVVAGRLPALARPLSGRIMAAAMSAELARALGLEPARALERAGWWAATSLRGSLVRFLPPRREPWFVPGRPMASYPNGYEASDLGPVSSDGGAASPPSPSAQALS